MPAQSRGVEEVFSTDCDSYFHNANIIIKELKKNMTKCKLIQSVEKSRDACNANQRKLKQNETESF